MMKSSVLSHTSNDAKSQPQRPNQHVAHPKQESEKYELRFFDNEQTIHALGDLKLEVVDRTTDILPDDFTIYKVLGVGANNRALKVQWGGVVRVLRVPRRTSDTRQRGSAKWEFAHTARASALECAPKLYRGWYMRHAENDMWPSGLYFLMEYFECDLQKVFRNESMWDRALKYKEDIAQSIVHILETLSNDELIVYDLKPANVVLRFNDVEEGDDDCDTSQHARATTRSSKDCLRRAGHKDDNTRTKHEVSPVTVRIIDYGRDFCEWGKDSMELDRSTPIIELLGRAIAAQNENMKLENTNEPIDATCKTHTGASNTRLRHILFATMLVNLAATTTRFLYHERRRTRMNKELRHSINPIAGSCSALVASMQGCNVNLLRLALRHDEVRGVLEHYHGRRCAGTKRTLRFALGGE